MTVGIAEDFAGYTTFLATPGLNILGSLSSDTVRALGLLEGNLILTVTPKLTAGFVLVVGTAVFASTDASVQEANSLIQFRWNDPGLDLSEGKKVAVNLGAPGDNTPATGAPTITGTAQVGQTLATDTSAIADSDGLTTVSYSYQWITNDGNTDTDIEYATGSTYELSDTDEGKTIKVRVFFIDDADNNETLTSAATVPVAAKPNTAATGLPTISGTAQVKQTLTADISGIADEDGLTNVSYSYQWIRSNGGTNADISGQTGLTYTLVSGDVGKTIKVRVTFTYDADNQETLTSAATVVVSARPNSPATGLHTISGTAQVKETLTADVSSIADSDGQTNVSYSYQWMAGGAGIDGATVSSYTLTPNDQGQTIQVRGSFTDDADNQESLTSEETAAVAPTPSPLTVSLENAATSHNGTDVFTFEIRFSEEFGLSYKTLKSYAFNVTGGSVKKAQRMDRDSKTPNILWLITVQPDSNVDVTITLPVTTDYTYDGAICTADGRKLSNSLIFTVSDPN